MVGARDISPLHHDDFMARSLGNFRHMSQADAISGTECYRIC